jgi:cytochrome c biogenesis protein CcdA
VIEGAFAVAFAAGLVAVANPCGFAMLPAYLSFFLGTEGQGDDARASVSRAIAVSLAVSAGFVATFAVLTAVIRNLAVDVLEWSPWISIAIGAFMALLGLAFLAGREPKINLPRLDRGGDDGSLLQMAVYGVSYAIVSLGCSIGPFMAAVVTAVNQESWLSAAAVFLTYAAGFTLLLTSLTVGIALASGSLVRGIRRTLPYVQRISGGILLLAGAYVAYYGWYELDRFGEDDPLVDRVTAWSNEVAVWITNTGPVRLGLVLAIVVAVAAVAVAGRRRTA